MQPAIVNVVKPPVTTVSFDTTAYLGKSQIRRNVGHSTSLYIAESVVDRVVAVPAVQNVELTEEHSFIEGLYLETDRPMQAGITPYTVSGVSAPMVIDVSKLLVLDMPIASLTLKSVDPDFTTNVKLVYGQKVKVTR